MKLITDTIAIINHGKTIHEFSEAVLDVQTLNHILLGESKSIINQKEIAADCIKELNPTFVFQNICTNCIQNLNLKLFRGDILTLLCENEVYITDLINLLEGQIVPSSGSIILDGQKFYPKDIYQAIKMGVCIIDGNSVETNLFYNMNVFDNFCIIKDKKLNSIWTKDRYKKSIKEYISYVFGKDISNFALGTLTTETLQKLAYYKWLFYKPKVAVCINPFSTVDIYMSRIAEKMIQKFSENGISVLIVSQNKSNLNGLYIEVQQD